MTAQASPVNEAMLRVRDSDLVAPVLARVVGMLAARAQCPIDRLDDAMLLTDAVAAHAPGQSVDEWTAVQVVTDERGLRLRIGPLAEGGAESLLSAAELPGVGNVFRRIATDVEAQHASDGELLLISLSFGR